MTVSVDPDSWVEENQRHLNGVIAWICARLEAHAAGSPVPVDPPPAGAAAFAPPPALESLSATFGLSPFEHDLVALCAGVELDARCARACSDAHGDHRRPFAAFALAFAVLPDGHWSALSPAGPLRRWRLIEVQAGESLTTSPLRIDERVLHHLTGVSYLDERLDGLVEPVTGVPLLASSHRAVAERAATLLAGASAAGWPAIQLCGSDRSATTSIAAATADSLGLGLLRLRADVIPGAPGERTALARLCERELAFSRCALVLVTDEDTMGEDHARRAAVFADEMSGPLLIAAVEPIELDTRRGVRLDVERLRHTDQRALWERALGEPAAALDGGLDRLVTQFDLDSDGIRAATDTLTASGADASFEHLWEACRVQARRRLDDLAQRMDSAAGWDDLVLPKAQLDALREISLHVRNARTVYDTWGFAARTKRGLGISALFAGPSGTGKTLAAEVLANELRLDLYRIDLSQVVSKYIGETEKNLRRIFAAAERSGAILLFDEADALFGRRSEVKDSHDRYANIEVGYLLQRMEDYRGLAVLTTNMRSALDPAFLRRIRFVIQFPFPDAAQREEIWRRAFPAQTPAEGIDPRRLARMSVAGGNIRNIAMNAAFLAAESGCAVRMDHILQAARSEYVKLEKALTAGELGGGL